ncbi:PREDICTED: X antigen family member 3-like [Cercocebus atys]|uniref:X antigen family member 3-like n=1 Tax=Cercocebus atys TaxID=9531 RepID=UPI0005F4DD68|nr:PREDICTED: X antigen family member 3-like [Cercocebus atys]
MIWRGRSTYRPRPRRSVPPPELIGPMLVMLDLEADLQEQSQSKTGDECGDGPDDQGKILPNSEEFKMPEGGDKQPQV